MPRRVPLNLENLERADLALPLRALLVIYKWSVVAPFLALSTLVIGSLVSVLSLLGMPNFASRVFATQWARLNLAVSLIGVDIDGTEKVDKRQSYVVVANHQSLIDIYVIYGYLGIDIKWVMKKELRAVPFLGIACQMMGHILIDRSDTEAAVKTINDARHRIRNGVSIVFFAEGTRSRTGELRPFKKGAFRLAKELGLPILPVSIHNTRKVLPSDTMDLMPGRVRLQFNDPIAAAEVESTDISPLANRTREIIRESLEADLVPQQA